MRRCILFVLLLVSGLVLSGFSNNNCDTNVSQSIVKELMPEPQFPLAEGTITEALDELGLSWVISEDETISVCRENLEYNMYTLRDVEERLHEDSEDTIFRGSVASGIIEGRRRMELLFDSRCHSGDAVPFTWEAWKQEMILGAMLYGGFEDKEEVYRVFCQLEGPDDDHAFQKGVQLSKGYCSVHKGPTDNEHRKGRYALWIDFFESEEHYQDYQQKIQEAYEKAHSNDDENQATVK